MNNIKNFSVNILNAVLDAVFPWKCVGCETLGDVLCGKCRAHFVYEKNNMCPFCKNSAFFGGVCKNCFLPSSLQQVFALFSYVHPIVRNIVHECKYAYVEKLGISMGELLYERFLSLGILPSPDNILILPIPLHRKRYLERGFNQAELIARAFSSCSQIELRCDILTRSRYQRSQVDVPHTKRAENVKGVFQIKNGHILTDKKIILIDDVMTTGSTLCEAARALREYHPQSVSAYVFAKG